MSEISITNRLIEHIIEAKYGTIDQQTVQNAKLRIIDVIACILAGSQFPPISILAGLAKDWGGKEESSIFSDGSKVPAHVAALVNSGMARSLDYETSGAWIEGKVAPVHSSATIIPTALAVAEEKGLSGKDLITACVIGEDLVTRIICASRYSFDSGWEPSGLVNGFGAAAAAGKLLGLDAGKMRNALGIVLGQISGTLQVYYDRSPSFLLALGLPAQTGIFSTKLAARGFSGVKDPLFGKHALYTLYLSTGDLQLLTRNLGKKYFAGATFKRFPCCRANHSAIECVLKITEKNSKLRAEEVEQVVVSVSPSTPAFVTSPFQEQPFPEVEAALSLQYNIANALLRKHVKLEHYTKNFINDENVLRLIKKIKINTESRNVLGEGARTQYPTTVEVKMRSGRVLVESVDLPRGNEVLSPFTWKEKREKVNECMLFSGKISKDNTERVLYMLDRLEHVGNIKKIVDLLCASNAKHSKSV